MASMRAAYAGSSPTPYRQHRPDCRCLLLSGHQPDQFQSAVKKNQSQPGNDFRAGNSALSLGLRYDGNPQWVPQLQSNL